MTRPYRVSISRADAPTRFEVIEADSWPQAWATAAERHGDSARFRVATYYSLMQRGDSFLVVGELDEERLALEGYLPTGPSRSYDCWIEAKLGFGMPLTERQQRLLEVRRALL